jgi:hypothetical protein
VAGCVAVWRAVWLCGGLCGCVAGFVAVWRAVWLCEAEAECVLPGLNSLALHPPPLVAPSPVVCRYRDYRPLTVRQQTVAKARVEEINAANASFLLESLSNIAPTQSAASEAMMQAIMHLGRDAPSVRLLHPRGVHNPVGVSRCGHVGLVALRAFPRRVWAGFAAVP